MKRLMSGLFIMTCALAVPISCNDDNGGAVNRKLLLTEVARNGVATLKLFYDTQRLLTRANTYSDGDLFNYILYEYNDQGIEEARRYNGDDHSLSLKAIFTLDNFARVAKVEFYTTASDFEEVAGIFTFSYEVSGQLKSRQFYVAPANTPEYRDEFTYDAAGNRTKTKRVIDPGQPKEYVSNETVYTPGGKMIPEHWNNFVFLLSVTNYDDSIREMFTIGSSRKSWESDGAKGGESRTAATERIFNTNGDLTRQVLTLVHLSSQSPDVVTELTYEYTE